MTYIDMTRVTSHRLTEAPPSRSRTGYGNKLPSGWMLQLDGRRWHRVYTVCSGTGGTDYVIVAGKPQYLETGWTRAFA